MQFYLKIFQVSKQSVSLRQVEKILVKAFSIEIQITPRGGSQAAQHL